MLPIKTNRTKSTTLMIFHLDFNFVNLRGDYLRHWLLKLADMGYNAILWELEDKVRWETCPECVWPEAMTKQEFRTILDYSRELGLEPIPLLQTIGHAEYVLLCEKYFSFRERSDEHTCYCTSNPQVKNFLSAWIQEYLDLFGDIRHFHLGGDEAYAFGSCLQCKAKANETGLNKLYADHITTLAQPLINIGIRPGIWGDMVLHHPEAMSAIPNNFVIWDWNYCSGDDPSSPILIWGRGRINRDEITEELIENYPHLVDSKGETNPFHTTDFLREKEFDVVLCSASRSAGDSIFCPSLKTHSQNVAAIASKVAKDSLMGNCVTSWAIRINNYETQELCIRLAPMALRFPDKQSGVLLEEIGRDVFGIDASAFFDAVFSICKTFPCCRERSTAIQWTKGKDSLPASPGYFSDYLSRTREDSDAWRQCLAELNYARLNFPKALEKLYNFAYEANRGFELISSWMEAAAFQIWQSKLAQAMIHEDATLEHIELAKKLKSRFQDYLSAWETPDSAMKNAGLVYDCLIEHLETNLHP